MEGAGEVDLERGEEDEAMAKRKVKDLCSIYICVPCLLQLSLDLLKKLKVLFMSLSGHKHHGHRRGRRRKHHWTLPFLCPKPLIFSSFTSQSLCWRKMKQNHSFHWNVQKQFQESGSLEESWPCHLSINADISLLSAIVIGEWGEMYKAKQNCGHPTQGYFWIYRTSP